VQPCNFHTHRATQPCNNRATVSIKDLVSRVLAESERNQPCNIDATCPPKKLHGHATSTFLSPSHPALRDALRDHEAEVLGLLSGLSPASGQNGQAATPESARVCAPVRESKSRRPETDQAIQSNGAEFAQRCALCQQPGTCYTCGGSEFWRSRWVERICCVCHPQLGTPERREAYEESAGILEYDAKMTRSEAERLAKEMT